MINVAEAIELLERVDALGANEAIKDVLRRGIIGDKPVHSIPRHPYKKHRYGLSEQIVQYLGLHGPSTASAIGAAIGQTTSSIHAYLWRMCRRGLIVSTFTPCERAQKNGWRTTMRVYAINKERTASVTVAL